MLQGQLYSLKHVVLYTGALEIYPWITFVEYRIDQLVICFNFKRYAFCRNIGLSLFQTQSHVIPANYAPAAPLCSTLERHLIQHTSVWCLFWSRCCA